MINYLFKERSRQRNHL